MLLTVDVARLVRAKEKALLQEIDSKLLNEIIPKNGIYFTGDDLVNINRVDISNVNDDYKDIYNPNKQPDPGAYAQIKADPNAAMREAGTNYETANNALLSGRPHLVKAYAGEAAVREVSNRW